MPSSEPLFATDTFLWGLAALCHLHRRPFAPNLVLQQFPPPYGASSLQNAAAALKLKSDFREASAAEPSLPVPFLAVLKSRAVPVQDSEGHGESGLAVVLGAASALGRACKGKIKASTAE